MADADLICNFKKCRKILNSSIWVTSCSHAFCEEDGSREFSRDPENNTCPACSTPLTAKYDVVKTNLNPTEQFKSMVLAGLRPETIHDIATRAISFWCYQVHQERIYQENSAAKIRERQHQLEEFYESALAQLKSTKKELENQTRRAEETAEQLREKIQQYQKLQGVCSSLRRTALASSLSERQRGGVNQPNAKEFVLGPKTLSEAIEAPNAAQRQTALSNNQGFNFQPVTPGSAGGNGRRPTPIWGQRK
ncbi:E3 ubiquitin-protein ligase CCNB1IP1-like isoform X2 [Ischnura elegans]|uniref:E3 ubiquitin-protein ligase CCNB1IP1-like isoform X2 n=1 Tax=Ischnura elegans TaxID=197161 RepID=UPI001ED8AEDC|nr:E3 ubiquitin-protein ligase CCNB1IP1-like isoform X2 [Ischnura elegans]